MLQAGFYECDITPHYLADTPGGFHKVQNKKICDPLKVRAIALSDGTEKAVLILGCGSVGSECAKRFRAFGCRCVGIARTGRQHPFFEAVLPMTDLPRLLPEADVVVLDMPLLDTRQNRDLTGTLIADIVLQLLSYVAQTEREFIKQRQKEGIAAAKARGVKFGRAPLERPAEFDQLQSLWLQGEVSAREAGRQLNVTHKTFLRWVQSENFG